MAFFKRVKKTVKPFVNVPRWIDAKTLIDTGKGIVDLTKKLFVLSKSTYSESFTEAMQRLQLTEQDILQRTKQFQLFTGIFFTGAILLFIYGFYLLMIGAYMAFFASFGLMSLLLGQAFRYHFWAYQMQKRRLGCSFSEWFNDSFKRIKK